MATAFAEPHDVGHRLWHMHDPGHPRHDSQWRAANGDPMARLVVELDAAIGRIVGAASEEATIVLFMGLGMGPNYTANKVLGTVLRRLDGHAAPTCLTVRARRAGAPPGALRITGRLDELFRQRADARSRYFQVPHNANAGAVRINLAGREPAGTVKPADFEGVRDQLERSLRRLVHPRNGRPIVADVVRVAEHYHGPRVAELPDLLVQWNREQPFDAVASAEVGTIHGARPWGRTGDHTPNAAFMIGGAGATGMDIERNLSVLDVAPTIAAMLDVSLPGIDGRSALLRSRTPVIDP
jgi:predicted AlkP superfamily phosphohydrolase/phosphomutase